MGRASEAGAVSGADAGPIAAARPSGGPGGRSRRRSLSDEVRDAIVHDFILSGAVPAGARLPTEAELGERYAVSRVTVRAAIRSLQQARLIEVRHGVGSTVLPRAAALPAGLDRLASLETFARDQGRSVSTAELTIKTIHAPGDIAAKLALPEASPVLVIQRAKAYNNVRVAWIVDYVVDGILPFDQLVKEFDGSVLDVLLSHDELGIDHSDCEVQAVALPKRLATLLHVPTATAAIYLEELTRTRDGQTVNLSCAWLLPEHFELRICRRRPLALLGL